MTFGKRGVGTCGHPETPSNVILKVYNSMHRILADGVVFIVEDSPCDISEHKKVFDKFTTS